ncbi:restriction endonuclease subunit S [Luteimonas sp. A478]
MTLASLPTYDSFKDSGVEWIGDVPSDWRVEPGRQCLYESKDKNTGMKEDTVLSLSYGRVIVKDEDKLTGLVPESFETYQIVEPGDIIIRGTDLQNDKRSLRTGLARDKGIITSAYINLRPKAEIDPVFLHYLLHSYDVKKVFYALGSGLRQNLSYDDFKYLRLPIPLLEEQHAIAAFLEEKCAKVDEAVRIKEEQIALLRERRQILIQQAVTRGLNPDVPKKDSGIDWVGPVPEHWDVKPLFTEAEIKSVTNKPDLPLLSVYLGLGVVKFEDVEEKRTNATSLNLSNYQVAEPGDLVLNNQQAWRGSVGVSFETGIVSPAYIVLELSDRFDSEFANLYFRSGTTVAHYLINSKGVGTIQRNLYWPRLKRALVTIPPLDEQRSIVKHVKRQCKKIDNGVAIKESQIAALKEYKTSLINAAVTGKIKVA